MTSLVITVHVQSARVYVYIRSHSFSGPELKYTTITLLLKQRILL